MYNKNAILMYNIILLDTLFVEKAIQCFSLAHKSNNITQYV